MALIITCAMVTLVVFSVIYLVVFSVIYTHPIVKCDDVKSLPQSDKVVWLIAFMVVFFWIIFSSVLAISVLLT